LAYTLDGDSMPILTSLLGQSAAWLWFGTFFMRSSTQQNRSMIESSVVTGWLLVGDTGCKTPVRNVFWLRKQPDLILPTVVLL